jgi:hypothetical protein
MKKITLMILVAMIATAISCKKEEAEIAEKPVASFTTSVDSVEVVYYCITCKVTSKADSIVLTNNSTDADRYVWVMPNGRSTSTTSKAPKTVRFNYYEGYNASIYNDCVWRDATITLKAFKGTDSSSVSRTFKLRGCD